MSIPNLSQFKHKISLDQAIEMTKRYRENGRTILNAAFNKNTLALSETFNKEALGVFMNDKNCKGIRIFYGMSEIMEVHAILVGVTDENMDILP